MRVVHIGYFYGVDHTGGAAIAAMRLHEALLRAGVDSIFVCTCNRGEGCPDVIEFPASGSLSRKMFLLKCKLSRLVFRRLCGRQGEFVNYIRSGLADYVNQLKPDVVHVHWIMADAVSLEELTRIKAPCVVHLHDMWMLNGFRPYPREDRRFVEGFTRKNSGIIERWLFARKRRFAESKNVSFIGPSQWVVDEANRSLIGKGHANYYVPYFQNPIFRLQPEMREHHDQYTILFGAFGGRSNPVKGFADLESALLKLPADVQCDIRVLVFGETAGDTNIGKVKVSFLGEKTTAEQMLSCYHMADLFAFPSRAETQGQTKLEAMHCGVPVVAFDRTACAEGIEHGVSGWVAADGDIQGFADGIETLYRQWKERGFNGKAQEVIRSIQSRYAEKVIAEKLIAVYRSVIS